MQKNPQDDRNILHMEKFKLVGHDTKAFLILVNPTFPNFHGHSNHASRQSEQCSSEDESTQMVNVCKSPQMNLDAMTESLLVSSPLRNPRISFGITSQSSAGDNRKCTDRCFFCNTSYHSHVSICVTNICASHMGNAKYRKSKLSLADMHAIARKEPIGNAIVAIRAALLILTSRSINLCMVESGK